MDPFLGSALINGVASLFGNRQQAQAGVAATRVANQGAIDQLNRANKFNVKATNRANKWNARQSEIAENRGRSNTKQAQSFSANQAAIANQFTKEQIDTAYQREEASDLRDRAWAQEDYAQQRQDLSTQFTDLRAAAEKGGFNPLSVLGTSMVPSMGAGGLASNSFGAGSGVAAGGFALPGAQTPPSSVPMSYGAPVAVAPLVSNDAVVGAVAELGQELTGANAVGRANDQIYADLAQVELERAMSDAPSGFGPRVPAPMGNFAVPAGHTRTSAPPGSSVGSGEVSHAGRVPDSYVTNTNDPLLRDDQPVEVVPATRSPFIQEIDNRVTDVLGGPMPFLGQDGEMVGIDELAGMAVQAAPMLAMRLASKVYDGSESFVRTFTPSLGGAERWDQRQGTDFSLWDNE